MDALSSGSKTFGQGLTDHRDMGVCYCFHPVVLTRMCASTVVRCFSYPRDSQTYVLFRQGGMNGRSREPYREHPGDHRKALIAMVVPIAIDTTAMAIAGAFALRYIRWNLESTSGITAGRDQRSGLRVPRMCMIASLARVMPNTAGTVGREPRTLLPWSSLSVGTTTGGSTE